MNYGPKFLSNLRDALISSPANDEVLTYETASGKWKNKAVSGGSLLLAEQTIIGSPVTTVTFTGLDANAHGGYTLIAQQAPSATIAPDAYLFYNNDTTQTKYRRAHQHYETLGGGSGAGQDATINLGVGTNHEGQVSIINIDIDATGQIIANVRNTTLFVDKTRIMTAYRGHAYIATPPSNITRIDFTAVNANGIAVGSIFKLFRRK